MKMSPVSKYVLVGRAYDPMLFKALIKFLSVMRDRQCGKLKNRRSLRKSSENMIHNADPEDVHPDHLPDSLNVILINDESSIFSASKRP
ncbi:hypothetical protein AC249_AIPGENE9216 [Exaiptasia diaphana]|nr:hypothetical protein AC249_AIPGENE9216 [Exaiptasia diaphana]